MSALRIFTILAIVAFAAGSATAFSAPNKTLEEYKTEKAAEAATASEAALNKSKMAAVGQVLDLLESLKSKVLAEGEEEAQTYNSFACWCKDLSKAKTEAISEGTDKKSTLTSEISTLASTRDTLDTEIDTCEKEIAETNKDMTTATALRKETQTVYEKNAADLTGAVAALENAIQSLKASKGASFVQIQEIAKTVEQAVLMADALGLGGDAAKHAVASLVQETGSQVPEVEMEDYKFHSDSIITTLENLLKDFVAEKNSVNSAEVSSVQEYELLMQEKTDYAKAKTLELEEARGKKAKTISTIAMKSQQLSTTAATLLDDQEYIKQLAKNCADKSVTWDKRSEVRADELSALTQAIGIIESKVKTKTSAATLRLAQRAVRVKLAEAVLHSPSAMQAIEAEAEAADESAPAAFLQRSKFSMRGSRRAVPDTDGGRQAIAALLRNKGAKLKSSMLSALASEVSEVKEDVFAKIKTMIQNLIDELLKEAASETDSKGLCDKELSDATQKRDYAANEVAELNAEMAELAATKNSLSATIATLTAEKTDLEKKQSDAEKLRAKEKADSQAAIEEATAGMQGVSEAIDLLDKWYKTNAKNTVNISFVQGAQPDAPDAGFESGEAYTGAFGDAGGIIGMMEVIKSDFQRTITETQKSEAIAEQEHYEFMTETSASLAEKTTALTESNSQLDDASEAYTTAEGSLSSQMTIMTSEVEVLISHKARCIDTGMSYNDRVGRREDEIASLKQALCILNAYKDFAKGGQPDNCGDLS